MNELFSDRMFLKGAIRTFSIYLLAHTPSKQAYTGLLKWEKSVKYENIKDTSQFHATSGD